MARRVFHPSDGALWPTQPGSGPSERRLRDLQPHKHAALSAWAESKEGLALQFEVQAQETHPDRHLIVDYLKEAVGLLFQEREPTEFERHHLVSAARGLDSSLPSFWRHSAREGACALRDPTGIDLLAAPAATAFTRQEFENYLAFLTPKR